MLWRMLFIPLAAFSFFVGATIPHWPVVKQMASVVSSFAGRPPLAMTEQIPTKDRDANDTALLRDEVGDMRAVIAAIEKNNALSVTSSLEFPQVIEKVVPETKIIYERVSDEVIEGKVSKKLASTFEQFDNKISAKLLAIEGKISSGDRANFQAVALTNRIDRLNSVTLSNVTLAGTLSGVTDDMIPDNVTITTTNTLTGTVGSFSGNVSVGGTLTVSATTTLSSSLVVGTSQLVVQQWNGNVGIGTTTPDSRLTVGGNISNIIQNGASLSTVATYGSLSIGIQNPRQVVTVGRIAYVTSRNAGTLVALDISDLANPVRLSSIALANNPIEVAVNGRYAYVTAYPSNLYIVDISNPAAMTLRSTFSLGGSIAPDGLAVTGRYAYVQSNASVLVVDVGNPASPLQVGSIPIISSGSPNTFATDGKYLYIPDQTNTLVYIYDISNPFAPTLVTSTSNVPSSVSGVTLSGNYAYIFGGGGLNILDVSDPRSPVLKGGLSNKSFYGAYLSGRYLYLTSIGDNTLNVVDIASSTAPVFVTSVGTGASPRQLAVFGRIAYVPNSNGHSISIVDISGIETTSASIHSLEAGSAQVRHDLFVAGGVDVKNTLKVGTGGIYSVGPLTVSVASTTQTGAISGLFQGVVGMGTAINPQGLLHISGGTTSPALRVNQTSTGNIFQLDDSGSSVLTVADGGNLGIGTSSPGTPLSVTGSAVITGTTTVLAINATSTATSTFAGGINVASGCFSINGTCVSGSGGGGGSGTVNTGASNFLAFFPADDTTVDDTGFLKVNNASGFLGIGTSTPGTPLSVTGAAVITGTTTAVNFNATNTTGYYINGTQVISSTALGSGITGSSLTSVGTITSGTWQGTTVATGFGGTGLASTPTFGQVLRGTGTGYALVATSTLNIALSDTTGTLAVSRGGTGATTFGGTNTILYTTAADTLASIATANNGVLVTSGTGVPSISSTIPSATQDNITRTGALASGSITNTFGAIDIGTDALTAGAGSFSSITDSGTLAVTGLTSLIQASSTRQSIFDRLYVGGTATTTIAGDNGNSTFSGFLGIGTSTPGTPLSVTGAAVITGTTTAVNFNATNTTGYYINGTQVISSTALGSGITGSSLTSVGTITSGTWQGTAVATGFGGTGLTSTPTFGQVLRGTGSGYALVATSTLNIALSDTTGTLAVSRGGTGATTFGGTNTILYTTAADTLSSIATANNGVLVTSGTGVPSISSTIPSATQDNITRTGALSSGSITNTFGSIDIGTDALTAGAGSFTAITDSGTLSVTGASTFTGLATFTQASSSRQSFFDRIYIGGTSTTTIAGDGGNSIFYGNLGLGTTTPGTPLSVTGDAVITGTSTVLAINATSTATSTFSGGLATGRLSITSLVATSTLSTGGLAVGGTQFVVQQSSGRVGVGTSTPAANMHISATQPSFLLEELDGPLGSRFWELYSNNGDIFLGGRSNDAAQQTEPALTVKLDDRIGVGTTSPFAKLTVWSPGIGSGQAFEVVNNASTTLLMILDNGRVGIGTTSPMEKLSVANGNIAASGCLKDAETGVTNSGTCVDLAELYPTLENLDAGDVVMPDQRGVAYVTRGDISGREKLIGVISTKPALLIEGSRTLVVGGDVVKQEGKAAVALSGRVPVKVTLEGGPISSGDYLTVSESEPGKAMKAGTSGRMIGVALESYGGEPGKEGKVLIFLNIGHANVASESSTIAGFDSIITKLKEWILSIKEWAMEKLTADDVYVRKSIEIGSADYPSGMTLYDQESKAPYCVQIRNGSIETFPGKCGIQILPQVNTAQVIDSTVPSEVQATNTATTSQTSVTTPESLETATPTP